MVGRISDDTCKYCDQPAIVRIQGTPCCRSHIDDEFAALGKVLHKVRRLAEDLTRGE